MSAFSLSSIQTWRHCQQAYYYKYIAGIKKRDRYAAPTLGSMLHEYLAAYYRGVQSALEPQTIHAASVSLVNEKYLPQINAYIQTAFTAGDADTARELAAVPDTFERIAQRYYIVHGKDDAQKYEILTVEREIGAPILDGYHTVPGIVDLVTRDRQTGRVHLWEHKSSKTIPDQSVRLQNLQVMLYAALLRHEGIEIDSVMWNYLRTKEPTIPDRLANGGLTKRSNIDTTWQTYLTAIVENDLNPKDYEEVRARLEGREQTSYFPRVDQVIVAREDILLGDFLQDINTILETRQRWTENICRPVRNLSKACTWCDYAQLCETVLMGGDEEDVLALRYKVRPPDDAERTRQNVLEGV